MAGVRPPPPIPVVALDFPTGAQAVRMADRLGERCRLFKVGSELFASAGPVVVQELRRRGAEVFLDLKFHDIPNAVAGAVRAADRLGVRLLAVDASGGAAMLKAAVDAAGGRGGASPQILAVTVLTSLSAADPGEPLGRRPESMGDEVLRLAALAVSSGAHGIVCSGTEAGRVRERFGDQLEILVPCVRLQGDGTGDRGGAVTPGEAVRGGATYVLVGRTVTGAREPVEAMDRVLRELTAG